MDPILYTGLLLAEGVGYTLGLAAKNKKAQISAGIRQVAALLGQSEGALHDGLRYEHDARSGREIQEKFSDSSGGEAWGSDKQSGAFSNIDDPTGADEHNVHGNEQRRRRDASTSAAKEDVNVRENVLQATFIISKLLRTNQTRT